PGGRPRPARLVRARGGATRGRGRGEARPGARRPDARDDRPRRRGRRARPRAGRPGHPGGLGARRLRLRGVEAPSRRRQAPPARDAARGRRRQAARARGRAPARPGRGEGDLPGPRPRQRPAERGHARLPRRGRAGARRTRRAARRRGRRGVGPRAAPGRLPRFIVMEHDPGERDLPTVVLVGKGVTFDTGGFSLKTHDGMSTMKGDMAGAAAVIGTMAAVAELAPRLRVVGLCPCVENMADGRAYRPSDVIVAADGTSIEVISTDAEGRLALADALVYAKRYRPSAVVDVATLTGASVVALGRGVSSSLFANDDGLAAELLRAAEESGERLWRMPLFEEYAKAIESQVADLKNSGGQGS